MKTAEGKKQISEAEKDAWVTFNRQFPNADKSKFVSQPTVESNGNVSAEIFFKASDDLLQSVFGSDKKYWSTRMKQALGLGDSVGFPYQLSPLRTKVSLPIPAVPFEGKVPIFHVYFTVRRVLYQPGGIQSMSALPGDLPFSQFSNRYDVASYKRLCNEFGINPSSDFCFTHGANHGLGSVYLYGDGAFKTDNVYPVY